MATTPTNCANDDTKPASGHRVPPTAGNSTETDRETRSSDPLSIPTGAAGQPGDQEVRLPAAMPDDGGEAILSGQPREAGGERPDNH